MGEAARFLLPSGFEWIPIPPHGGVVYTRCRRAGLEVDGMHHLLHQQ